VRFDAAVGHYAITGAALCTIWPAPDDGEEATHKARGAVVLGTTRSLLQDPTYAVRQVADVAIKALSPGVNDPTTAQDAIFHLGTLVREFLCRQPPPRVRRCGDDRDVVLSQLPDHASVVRLAFEETRIAAAPYPAVCIYLLEVLRLVESAVAPPAAPMAVPLLHEQAERLLGASTRALDGPEDIAEVRRAFAERFGARAVPPQGDAAPRVD
jgi:uncharacterized membrane protein